MADVAEDPEMGDLVSFDDAGTTRYGLVVMQIDFLRDKELGVSLIQPHPDVELRRAMALPRRLTIVIKRFDVLFPEEAETLKEGWRSRGDEDDFIWV